MPTGDAPTLLFLAPSAKFFLSHRAAIGRAAIADGFSVVVACPRDDDSRGLEALGMVHVAIPLSRSGNSPWGEARTLWSVWRAFRRVSPSIAHLITAKPALHGGLAGRFTGTPTVTAVTGLGHLFIRTDWRARAARAVLLFAYRLGLRRSSNHFIFQNSDDQETFRSFGLLAHSDATILPGSGVDLERITPAPLPSGNPVVLMPSRMLADKGVWEFVEASRLLATRGINARMRLLGDPDAENPTSLTLEELQGIPHNSPTEWQPHTADIAAALAEATIVVLPSYREGFPKTLIDAAAAGRAMVATDVQGCRDAIVAGETGLLCRVRDAGSLADQIATLLTEPGLAAAMGQAARKNAVARFDLQKIIAAHLALYRRYRR